MCLNRHISAIFPLNKSSKATVVDEDDDEDENNDEVSIIISLYYNNIVPLHHTFSNVSLFFLCDEMA